MKQKVVFLGGLIVFLIFVGIGVTAIRNRSPKQGELKVESEPSASVFLDDKHIGRTPIGKTSYKVNAGEYTLKIVPDAGITSYAAFQEKIKVGPNMLTYIEAVLSESELTTSSYVLWLEKMSGKKGEVSVVSTPDGATVLLDDDPKGNAPVTIPDVSSGDHTLVITSRGFVTKTIKIRVNAGYRLIASVKLALSPSSSVVDAIATPSGILGGTPIEKPSGKAIPSPSPSSKPTPISVLGLGDVTKPYILIKDTPTGFLRVRNEASTSASEVTRVKPGEKYPLVDTKTDWYQIRYDASRSGWISGQYGQKVE